MVNDKQQLRIINLSGLSRIEKLQLIIHYQTYPKFKIIRNSILFLDDLKP